MVLCKGGFLVQTPYYEILSSVLFSFLTAWRNKISYQDIMGDIYAYLFNRNIKNERHIYNKYMKYKWIVR